RIKKYQDKFERPFIIGRGWDQSLWKDSKLPSNKRLNEMFPDTPVCLFRIDGHAVLANDYLINKSDVINNIATDKALSDGGYYISDDGGNVTGVFVDNAMNPILDILPDFPEKELIAAILEVQSELFMYGITGVHEAGLKHDEVALLEKLIQQDKLDLNIYGMLLPTEENIAFARKNGVYVNDNLLIRSFKVYGDGAMGSRGAFLKHPYADKHDHQGYLTTSIDRMKEIATICTSTGYQMNTHAIGDSTNRIMLELYHSVYQETPDHRWRIEHAQVVDPKDFKLFADAGVFPSVQPTHATSDQRWAESRLGASRMEGAYAYNSLLNQFGMLAIGTDFPVENIDPFRTIHAAVKRTDTDNIPGGGFLPKESITLEECIRGMTIWAAMASFQENELGTIEKGKDATISIFVNQVNVQENYRPNFAYMTFIKGKKVYSVE
ncbi:MAG: amidohydrolase, partial [Crocinitomicaceae bacterium]|nr:amidohydrolase [Crocinitomicaceae bacterium]